MKVTQYYKFPLQWDQYPTDQVMIEEALTRIDKAIHSVVFEGGGTGSNVIYDGVEANPGETVSDALDLVIARTNQFEIVAGATTSSDVNEILWSMAVTRPFLLPTDLEGSAAVVSTMTPIDLVIRIEHNGSPVGSIDILQDVASFTFPSDVNLVKDDELSFISEGDVSFRSISITLLASRL